MPKPVPEYIPGELRDQIAVLGYSGVMEYSEHLGLNPQRLLSVFGGKHTKLKPYWNLSRRAGMTMDSLAEAMINGRLESIVSALCKKENRSIRSLSISIDASDSFLSARLRGEKGLNGLQAYIEVAQALGWTLEKLAENCLR